MTTLASSYFYWQYADISYADISYADVLYADISYADNPDGRQVRHENIVQVQEIVIGDTMDEIFIVMEFVAHDVKVWLRVRLLCGLFIARLVDLRGVQ